MSIVNENHEKCIESDKTDKHNNTEFKDPVNFNLGKNIEKQIEDNLNNIINFDSLNDKKNFDNSTIERFEGELSNKKTRNKKNTIEIFKTVVPLNSVEKFIEFLNYKLSEKKLLFIRHVEAEHNAFNKHQKILGLPKPKFFDPSITEFGGKQSEEIAINLKNLDFEVNVVFTSPLRRTLQTLEKLKNLYDFRAKNFIVTELLREEVINQQTHTGHTLSKLKDAFNHIDYLNYDYILKEIWWCIEHEEDCHHTCFSKETKLELNFRIALFLIWFILREERNAIVISHSKIYKAICGYPPSEKPIKNSQSFVIDHKIIMSNIVNMVNDVLYKGEI